MNRGDIAEAVGMFKLQRGYDESFLIELGNMHSICVAKKGSRGELQQRIEVGVGEMKILNIVIITLHFTFLYCIGMDYGFALDG